MTDSTPSLQEIYLSACRSFDELTNNLLQGFNSAVDQALSAYSEQEAEALQKSTNSADVQSREILNSLQESLEAITHSVDGTVKENERFLEHVQEELLISCRSLQQEISDLSESLLRSHNISSKVLMAKLSGQCDKSVDSVQQVANRARHSLKEQSHMSSTQFGEALVEKQSRQFSDLMAYENQARKEIPDMLSAVIARARLHEPKLSMLNRQQNDQIDARIEQLKMKTSEVSDVELARIISTASATEQQLRKNYEETKAQLLATNENYTRDYYLQLEETSNKSRLETSQLLSTLRNEMMDALNQATSDELDRGQSDMDRAKQLFEELQNLIEDQRLIAAQKSTVIAQIMEEMKEVEKSFESKLEKMSAAQLNKLSNSCNTALNDISTTRKGIRDKIENLSDMYMQQIEEEEERILKIIERRLEKALGFIDQALGGED